MTKVFLDFETGGLDCTKHSPLQLAVMFVKDNQYINEAEQINIKLEDYVVTPKALEINGLDIQELYETGYTPHQIVQIFRNAKATAQEKLTIVGQNVSFDIGFLKELFKMAGAEKDYERIFDIRSIDLQSILYFLNDTNFQNINGNIVLDTALKYYKIPQMEDRHTALTDVILTASLYKKITDEMNLKLFNI